MQETVPQAARRAEPRADGRDAVLSVGAGPAQLPLIRAAAAAGFAIWAIDRADIPAAADLLEAHLRISTFEAGPAVAAARAHPMAQRTRAVIQRTSGPALATAAALAAALDVAGPPAAFCAAAVRKSVLREAATALGLPCPAGRLVADPERDLPPDLPLHRGLLAKPDMPLRGKAAVVRLPAPPAGTPRAVAALLRDAAEASANGKVEVQDWLPGQDIGLLLLLAGGTPVLALAYDEIVAQQADGSVRGLGLAAPATGMGAGQLTALALPLARSLGMDRGFAFFSFRADAGGRAHLYEANPGLCGDGIADLLLPGLFPGFDPFAAEIAAWTGGDPLPAGPLPAPGPATLLGTRLLPGDAAANAAALAAAASAGGGRWTAAAA
ncbi:hypothetical protein ACFOGJ_19355 [Marinibaculum pumilum]|uniref:ATP-grasp domain-containing protein n=1 Tax=Marinibaculum pumilum TaxID=1766165 RepID=A0ABV7L469_9PROT